MTRKTNNDNIININDINTTDGQIAQIKKKEDKKMKKAPTNLDVITYSLTVGLILGIAIGLASGVIGMNNYNEYKYSDCICPIDTPNRYQPIDAPNRGLTIPNIPDIE